MSAYKSGSTIDVRVRRDGFAAAVTSAIFSALLLVQSAGAAEVRSAVWWSVTSMSSPYATLASHEEYGPVLTSGVSTVEYVPQAPDAYGSAAARASAAFGTLGGFATVQRTAGTTPNVASWRIQTFSSFFDTLTIDAPGLTGTAGTTEFMFSITGSSTLTATPDSNPYWSFWNDARYYLGVISKDHSADPSEYLDYLTVDGTGPGDWVTLAIPFVYGSPFDVGVLFNVDARLGVQALALSDFSHTAALTDVDVFDSVGARVTAFTLSSDSGARYPVPEPGTFALALLGVAAFAAARRRKQ